MEHLDLVVPIEDVYSILCDTAQLLLNFVLAHVCPLQRRGGMSAPETLDRVSQCQVSQSHSTQTHQ